MGEDPGDGLDRHNGQVERNGDPVARIVRRRVDMPVAAPMIMIMFVILPEVMIVMVMAVRVRGVEKSQGRTACIVAV